MERTKAVFEELCQIVEEAIALYHEDSEIPSSDIGSRLRKQDASGGLNDALISYNRDGEPVVALTPHSLYRRCGEARLIGEQLEKPPHATNVRIGVFRVDHGPLPNDVIHDDHCPWTGEFQRPTEIFRDAWLIGVDKDEVKWAI
jgi:hypothetical protein